MKSAMVGALQREWEMRRDFFKQTSLEMLSSVYFGGGTPSVLSPEEIGQILESIRQVIKIAQDAEVTLEANPDDLSPHYLTAIRKVGINRLSIGIQSFQNQDLAWMNRSHSLEQALACVPNARAAGFSNQTIDLIFGGPDMTLEQWQKNLDQALELKPEHISLYALEVSPQTALQYQVSQNRLIPATDEAAEQQFLLAHDLLTSAGYDHYELSSYALPGYEARHNSGYWAGKPYLGLGPSAHSFDGKTRWWNLTPNSRYLKAIEAGEVPTQEHELITPKTACNEYLMTRLRTKDGLSLSFVEKTFGYPITFSQRAFLGQLAQEGYATWEHDQFALSPRGWIRSDQIIGQLFWD